DKTTDISSLSFNDNFASKETVNICLFSPKYNKLAYYFVLPYKTNCDNPHTHRESFGKIVMCNFDNSNGMCTGFAEVDSFYGYFNWSSHYILSVLHSVTQWMKVHLFT